MDLGRLIFDASEAGQITISTSTVTLVEVRRGPDSLAASDQAQIGAIDSLFDQSLTRFVDLDHGVALLARLIANQYGVRTMDAIQVASAEAAGCDELFIWDNQIVSKLAADPVPGLSVCEPHWER